MKTNVVMKRPFAGFDVLQRTSDGYFNATSLIKVWNESVEKQQVNLHGENSPYVKKELKEYLSNKSTVEFIQTIVIEEQFENEKSVISKSRASRGNNFGTWMHPFLFIDFAMWINPSFKYKVIKFVHDEMILYRKKSADSYKTLCDAVYNLLEKDKFRMQVVMSEIAKAINYVVFNNHYKEIRNDKGTEDLMKELHAVEERLAYLINNNYVKTTEDIIKALRKEYKNKWFGNNLLIDK